MLLVSDCRHVVFACPFADSSCETKVIEYLEKAFNMADVSRTGKSMESESQRKMWLSMVRNAIKKWLGEDIKERTFPFMIKAWGVEEHLYTLPAPKDQEYLLWDGGKSGTSLQEAFADRFGRDALRAMMGESQAGLQQ